MLQKLKSFNQVHKLVTMLAGTLLLVCQTSYANELNHQESLDKKFTILSDKIYQSINLSKPSKINQLSEFNAFISSHIKNNEPVLAVAAIQNHMPVIYQNINSEATFNFMEIALKNHNANTAVKIYRYAIDNAEDYYAAKAAYVLAQYFFEQEKWQTVINTLNQQTKSLPDKEAQHALILLGSSLQYLKQHRAAIQYYKKIPTDSDYHYYAQLNTAIAYLRQGWWTDAHLLIKQTIDNKKTKHNNHTDRLYTVLGYSLLREEFYRDAREAFRNIRLDSIYVNQALMGIALSAAGQSDFIGALNALKTLKRKKENDLPIEESYVLLPYMYQQLGQQLTATAAYKEAMSYYEQRIQGIDQAIQTSQAINSNDTGNQTIESRIDLLQRFSLHIENSQLRRENAELLAQYQQLETQLNLAALQQRRLYLNSYLNQSRYGLAYLYDQSHALQK